MFTIAIRDVDFASLARVRPRFSSRQEVPCNLTLERAWRWCIVATIRELRVARSRGRDIAWQNLRRIFMRRWADTCSLYDFAEDSLERQQLSNVGLMALSDAFASVRRCGRAA